MEKSKVGRARFKRRASFLPRRGNSVSLWDEIFFRIVYFFIPLFKRNPIRGGSVRPAVDLFPWLKHATRILQKEQGEGRWSTGSGRFLVEIERNGPKERNALGLRRGRQRSSLPPSKGSLLEFEREREKKARYRGTSSLFPLRFQLSRPRKRRMKRLGMRGVKKNDMTFHATTCSCTYFVSLLRKFLSKTLQVRSLREREGRVEIIRQSNSVHD